MRRVLGNFEHTSKAVQSSKFLEDNPGGGVLIYFPHGDVPLNRVSFSGFQLRDRVSFL